MLGPQNAIWRLNWTYHNLREVLFQSSQNEEVYPFEGEFFFVQVPACPKDIQEQGKEMEGKTKISISKLPLFLSTFINKYLIIDLIIQ